MKQTQNFIMKPKIDFCFKELMAAEKVRQGFIAALLNIPPDAITGTVLLPTELHRDGKDDKLGILDVRVSLADGTQIDMEMQVESFAAWPERSLYYLCRMYCHNLHTGENYDTLKKCIHVGILDFVLFDDTEDYYSCYHLRRDSDGRCYSDKLEIHILELPKINEAADAESSLLNWAKFFRSENKEEMEMLAEKDEYISKAYERLTDLSQDDEKWLEYESRLKAILDHQYLMQQSQKEGWDRGHAAGLEAGHAAGQAEGRIEGSRQRLIELVQKKHSMGQSASKIAEDLMEDLADIQKILDELDNPSDPPSNSLKK